MGTTFGELLKKFRTKYKVSKIKISRDLGVSQSYPAHLENYGKLPPNFDTCKKIARSIGLNSEETKELLLAARSERFNESDMGFLSLSAQDEVEKLIREQYGPLFEDEGVIELLYQPNALTLLKTMHQLPPSSQADFIKSALVLAKGYMEAKE